MKKRLGIATRDDIFFNKTRLILRDQANAVRINEKEEIADESFDVLFTDTASEYAHDPRFITFGVGGDIPLPCPYDELKSALNRGIRKDPPLLYIEDRCAYLRGRPIELTATEARILKILLDEKNGVTSFRIMELMCDKCFSYNSLKVYINFLRKKLESDGDKIIFSTRIPGGCSYTIHEKYRTVHYDYDI